MFLVVPKNALVPIPGTSEIESKTIRGDFRGAWTEIWARLNDVLRPGLSRVDLLDPRSAGQRPIGSSVWIPWAELGDRVHELPTRDAPLRVARVDGHEQAIALLLEDGRQAKAEDCFSYGETGRHRLWSPNAFLETCAPHLEVGTCLDLACGSGRDSVYLAALGWEVTAVDHLPDALTRAADLERRYLGFGEPPIAWVLADLAKEPEFEPRFDLICLFFYFDAEFLARAWTWLAPGGSLLVESFSPEHRDRFGKPRDSRKVVSEEALRPVLAQLQVRLLESGLHEGRYTTRVWATRSS